MFAISDRLLRPAAIALLLAPVLAQSGGAALTPRDRKVMVELTSVKETKHIVFHYRARDLTSPSTEAHMVFGKTLRRLERDWLAWLDLRKVDRHHRDHVLKKLGLLRKKIPDTYLTAKGTTLFDGRSATVCWSEPTPRPGLSPHQTQVLREHRCARQVPPGARRRRETPSELCS